MLEKRNNWRNESVYLGTIFKSYVIWYCFIFPEVLQAPIYNFI